MVRYRVVVDRVTCTSCKAAPAACSEVFELGDDNGKNRVATKCSVNLTPEIPIGIVPTEINKSL